MRKCNGVRSGRRSLSPWAVGLAVSLLLSAHSEGGTSRRPPAHEDGNEARERAARIQRIVHGLLPSTSIEGKWGEPATLGERMAFYHTPGVSIAVINNGRLEWARGFGTVDAGGTAQVTEETLFQCGSVSKPVFASAVVRLVQRTNLIWTRTSTGI
jgi:CubicO group peptidase (beta-lactamase class C family)